jgi:hypothetical protein
MEIDEAYAGTDPLAVLTGLTSLIYGNNDPARVDAVWAVAQLTRLRRLILQQPSTFTEAQLAQLSALRRLTSLEIEGRQNQNMTGSWLAALAAARVPLRSLSLHPAIMAGCGAEGFIGQLTRLTSLHMALNWRRVDTVPQLGCADARRACVPLQLRLLGCNRAVSAAGGDGSVPGCSGSADGSPAARRNTGLQELSLLCPDWLSDDELAAAAAALPDLRRLSIEGCKNVRLNNVEGLSGAGLAAFSVC